MRYKVIAEASSGESIDSAGQRAIDLARRLDAPVYLTHNDTEVIVLATDSARDVVVAWDVLRSQLHRRVSA